MKTNIDDATIQAAIDEAFTNAEPITFWSVPGTIKYDAQKFSRLHLLKSALDRLPEPTPPKVAAEDLMVLRSLLESAHTAFESPKAGGFTFLCEAKQKISEMMKGKPEPTQPWTPKVGDKVQLKGGSFIMTVEQADSDGIACEWHDSNGVPQGRTYTPETLQPA